MAEGATAPITSYTNLQEPAASSFPSPFNGLGERMLHPRIAVWSYTRNNYQIYTVYRSEWPAIQLIPTNTERTQPFYFVDDRTPDAQSRTFTLYRPRARLHSHTQMAIWHTGGWLCRREGYRLVPVLPILAVSDISKLQWQGNVGLRTDTPHFEEWRTFQSAFHYRPIIHNRLQMPTEGAAKPNLPTEVPLPPPIPAFVAEALLEKAIAAEESCPISMEPLAKGDAYTTSCFHLFQRDALDEWLTRHTTCPVCKATCTKTAC